jgi:hypothetical protein
MVKKEKLNQGMGRAVGEILGAEFIHHGNKGLWFFSFFQRQEVGVFL